MNGSHGGANGGNVTLPCAQHSVNYRLARELDVTRSSKKCRALHLPHTMVISPKGITWFPPWFVQSNSHWALHA